MNDLITYYILISFMGMGALCIVGGIKQKVEPLFIGGAVTAISSAIVLFITVCIKLGA